MKTISWNIHGGKKPHATTELIYIKNKYNPDIMFILETMTNHTNSKRILQPHNFQNTIIIDPINYRGGIWVCWSLNNLSMINHDSHNRCAHIRVLYKPLSKHFMITGAYFPAKEDQNQTFWDYMESVLSNIDIQWLLIGDFNELLSPNDKAGGNPPSRNQCTRLPPLPNSLHATDIPYLQQTFSWKMN